jgi:hypothetical protein
MNNTLAFSFKRANKIQSPKTAVLKHFAFVVDVAET